MRSSRSVADPLDPGPAGFAHRGLHYGAQFPENSLIAFAAALELGCGIECDLRLTADNQVLVFHDADAWRMCASPLRIGRSTHAELGRLRLGEGPIPTLASLFTLVRTGGDKQASDQLYANMNPMTAEDLAETLWWIATLPPHLNINAIELMPTSQSFAGFTVSREA